MQPGQAEIVGAGFGGLVAAMALAQHGWTVRVHERRSSLRGEGYGIAIHNNMARIFDSFGILDRVIAVDEGKAKPLGEPAAHCGLAGTHQSDEDNGPIETLPELLHRVGLYSGPEGRAKAPPFL